MAFPEPPPPPGPLRRLLTRVWKGLCVVTFFHCVVGHGCRFWLASLLCEVFDWPLWQAVLADAGVTAGLILLCIGWFVIDPGLVRSVPLDTRPAESLPAPPTDPSGWRRRWTRGPGGSG